MLSSNPVKYIGLGLLILGLLLLFIGTAGSGENVSAIALLLVAAIGLVRFLATDMFHIGRGRPVFVYNFLDLERFRWQRAVFPR